MTLRLIFLSPIVVLLASACSSQPVRDIGLDKIAPRKAEQELALGLKNYEDGRYPIASKNLQNALNNGLTFKSDRVTAHKYLAFVHCVSERKKQCRNEFKQALEINPTLRLSAAEAGHPVWGPVFREVLAEQGQSKK